MKIPFNIEYKILGFMFRFLDFLPPRSQCVAAPILPKVNATKFVPKF